MPAKPKRSPLTHRTSKKKAPAAVETSESIQEQVKAFLKSGNKIDVIASGISGQPSLAKPKSTPTRDGR